MRSGPADVGPDALLGEDRESALLAGVVGVDGPVDALADPAQLLHLGGRQRVEHESAYFVDVAGGGGVNLVLLALAAVVAIGRFSWEPFAA